MATVQLSASARSARGKGPARSLRRDGRVPGVIYGHARPPQSLSLHAHELRLLLEKISAESTVIELSLDGSVSRTLIREIQRDPLKRTVLHVDFQELVAGEKVIVRIPIVLVGTPAGVRQSGGIMSQVLNELEVRVDPADIPNRIEVDVTEVAIGHSVHVSEIKVPAGVEVLANPGDTIAVVAAPKEEIAPVVAEVAEVPVEPELIRKPKEDEEVPEEK